MTHVLSPAELDLLSRAQAFVDAQVLPQAAHWQRDRVMPAEALRGAAALGLTGLQLPVEQGGLGLSFTCKVRLAALLAGADFGFSLSLINTHGVAATLAKWLPPAVSQRWIPTLLSAERLGCTALTEPGAGSDFSAIRMQASSHPQGWLLHGEKAWIINARAASVFVVYAQTQPGAGGSGIAAFVVDGTRPGFRRTETHQTEAAAALGVSGFALDGYLVPQDEVLHPPGAAFKRALGSINFARTYVAAMCCGMVRQALQIAWQHGQTRQTFGKPLSQHQGWRWRLAEAAVALEAAESLVNQACDAAEQGLPLEALAARAKVFATRMACEQLGALLHAMGAAGFHADHPFGRHLAAAQMATLVDGSTEMLLERVFASLRWPALAS